MPMYEVYFNATDDMGRTVLGAYVRKAKSQYDALNKADADIQSAKMEPKRINVHLPHDWNADYMIDHYQITGGQKTRTGRMMCWVVSGEPTLEVGGRGVPVPPIWGQTSPALRNGAYMGNSDHAVEKPFLRLTKLLGSL